MRNITLFILIYREGSGKTAREVCERMQATVFFIWREPMGHTLKANDSFVWSIT